MNDADAAELVRTAAELARAQGERLAELNAKVYQLWQKGERLRTEIRALFDAHYGQVMSDEQLKQVQMMLRESEEALEQYGLALQEIRRIRLFNLPVPNGPMQ